jgi:F420-0:gamma-glutamyl ligase
VSRAANETDSTSYQVIALKDFPRVHPGDNLTAFIIDALERMELTLRSSDIVVIAQKIVSKAEGRYARLNELTPTADALDLAAKTVDRLTDHHAHKRTQRRRRSTGSR